jgi:hypothetical protein
VRGFLLGLLCPLITAAPNTRQTLRRHRQCQEAPIHRSQGGQAHAETWQVRHSSRVVFRACPILKFKGFNLVQVPIAERLNNLSDMVAAQDFSSVAKPLTDLFVLRCRGRDSNSQPEWLTSICFFFIRSGRTEFFFAAPMEVAEIGRNFQPSEKNPRFCKGLVPIATDL